MLCLKALPFQNGGQLPRIDQTPTAALHSVIAHRKCHSLSQEPDPVIYLEVLGGMALLVPKATVQKYPSLLPRK